MDLLQKILDCKEEEVNAIVKQAIEDADAKSNKVEELSPVFFSRPFKGFIPLNARIKYIGLALESYSMQTTDFMYEFAHFIKKNNINSKGRLIYALGLFINSYFGLPDRVLKERREQIFFTDIYSKTKSESDVDLFKALENNKIGDLKHKDAAQCTERAALAQQILSLFGTESYYCFGCLGIGKDQEGHAFNVIKRENDYAVLDYSCVVKSYNKENLLNAYFPFIGILSNEEFADFINNKKIKRFQNYEFFDNKSRPTTGERIYVVGEMSIDKEKIDHELERE